MEDDWGINMADTIAESSSLRERRGLHIFQRESDDVYAALTPVQTWQWREGTVLFDWSVRKRAQRFNFEKYRKKIDIKRIYENKPTRCRYILSLMNVLTRTKRASFGNGAEEPNIYLYD
jgi:hypothetical protein